MRSDCSFFFKVTGFFSAMKNIGKIRNSGWELTLNTVNIQTKNFKWSSNFNIAFNKNKVLELAENQTALLTSAYFDQNYNAQPTYISKVGYPMGMMYGYIYEGTYKYDDFYNSGGTYTLRPDVPAYTGETNTQPGMPKYKDVNGDGKIDSSDRTFIGRGQPIHTGGFTNDFSYKGFDLSLFLQGIAGAKGMLSEYAGYAFFAEGNLQKWQMEGAFNEENPERYPAYPRLENLGNSGGHNTQTSDFWVRNANYLRIKNIQLGYTLPKSITQKCGISNLRVYVASENPYTFHSMPSGWDPEIVLDADNQYAGGSFYPVLRNFTFGVNLKF